MQGADTSQPRNGNPNRRPPFGIFFNEPAALSDLNALTHPAVGAVMMERLAAEADTDRVVILDIPLLAEGGRGRYAMAGVLVVDTPIETAVRMTSMGAAFFGALLMNSRTPLGRLRSDRSVFAH